MPRTGLSYKLILDTAYHLVEEKGLNNFSMRDLAKELGIKAPSLYNHFSGIQQLQQELALKIEQELYQKSIQAMEKLSRDDMIRALAHTQLEYARKHPQLYQVILSLPAIEENLVDHSPKNNDATNSTSITSASSPYNSDSGALSASAQCHTHSAASFAIAQSLSCQDISSKQNQAPTHTDGLVSEQTAPHTDDLVSEQTATHTDDLMSEQTVSHSANLKSVNPSLAAIQQKYGLADDDYYFRHFQQFQRPNAAWHSVEPIRIALSQYKLSDSDSIHLNRMFRSMIHGYIGLSAAGYLAHQKYSTEESFDAAVEYFITIIHLREEDNLK